MRTALPNAYPALPGFRRTAEDLCRLAGVVGQHHQGNQVPADAEEGRDAAMAPRARLRPADASARITTAEPWGTPPCRCLHALIFDFLNYASGRLDPSYAAIARKANVCERTVANALKRLKRARHPQLGAPLRRELAGRALRA